MDQLVCDGSTILEGDHIIGTVSKSRSSIDVTGNVNISLKKERGGYSILEDSMPMGKVEKNLKINYQGKIYEPERRGLYNFITGRDNEVSIYSLGTVAGRIARDGTRLIVRSDNPVEKVPFIIYLMLFSSYRLPAYGTRRRAQALPSPYRQIYYVLIAAFFALFIFLSLININPIFYSIILIAIVVAQFAVYYAGMRKV